MCSDNIELENFVSIFSFYSGSSTEPQEERKEGVEEEDGGYDMLHYLPHKSYKYNLRLYFL